VSGVPVLKLLFTFVLFAFKMEKLQSCGVNGAGIFRDIGLLQDSFKASRVVSW